MKQIIHGKVENGRIIVPDDVELPEGATVSIQVRNSQVSSIEDSDDEEAASMLERMGPIVGSAKTLPPDAARNVDHYLYGHPKNE